MNINGGVASPHWLATNTGYAELDAGGTAIDAVIAAAAVLAVVLPNRCSIGGDVVAAVSSKKGIKIVNGTGRAGTLADDYRANSKYMPDYGAQTVTVPGVIDAWETIRKLGGKQQLRDLLAPALSLATEGFRVSAGLSRAIKLERLRIGADPGLAHVFLTNQGLPISEGQLLVQPALATVLECVADGGPDAFYKGEPAKAISGYLTINGGLLTEHDFESHTSTVEEPISTSWMGSTWYTSAPPTQGIGLIQVLDALTYLSPGQTMNQELKELLPALFNQISIDRDTRIGSNQSSQETIEHLLGEKPVAGLVDRVKRGITDEPRGMRKPTGDTVAIVAIDKEGNAATLIQSVFHAFGSGILEPSTGIVLQNRGSSFTIADGVNMLRAGARPMHTLMPVLVSDGQGSVGARGTMGGKAQPQIHVQIALALQEGMDAQEAVDAPRFTLNTAPDSSDSPTVHYEPGVEPEILKGASESGYSILSVPRGDDFGHAQIVRRLRNGHVQVGTDSRADGLKQENNT